MGGDALEPEGGGVGGRGDGVAVVVGCEVRAVVPDEGGCDFFDGDVWFLGQGDCGAVGLDEGCGCFEEGGAGW